MADKEREPDWWGQHIAAKTRSIDETAEWMAAEVKDRGKLEHHEAANDIRQRRHYEMMRFNLIIKVRERNDRDGSIREICQFSPLVLDKFRELTGKTVRWGKKDRYWVFKPKARSA